MYPLAQVITSSPDEVELTRRASKGDVDAFSELYTLYFDQIYRFVYYRVGRVAEAEDLTEQAFLKAWQAIGRYEDRGSSFPAWLYRIARNAIIDSHRTRKDAIPLEDLPPLAADEDLAPEEVLAKQEEVKRLQTAIAQLSEEQQQVIILRFIEGVSHAEVAAIIGKSEGASRVVQHRALAALHDILSEER